jgi:hypothetical protein
MRPRARSLAEISVRGDSLGMRRAWKFARTWRAGGRAGGRISEVMREQEEKRAEGRAEFRKEQVTGDGVEGGGRTLP